MLLVGVSGNDPKNDFEIFLANYAWLVASIAVSVIILVIVVFLLINKNKKGNKKVEIKKEDTNKWIEALGGIDNISDISSTGSRLTVKLNNKELINRDSLNQLGVTSIVMMSDKVTLVTNLDNTKIVEYVKNCLQN